MSSRTWSSLWLLTLLLVSRPCHAEFGKPFQQPSQKEDRAARRDVENPEEPPAVPRETGFYQAGPRSGAFEGPSQTMGLRGGGITLPEIRLLLPTIELPSCFRSSQHARMVYKGGEAPWISTGFQGPAEDQAGDRGAPSDEDATSRDADGKSMQHGDELSDLREEYQQKLDTLDRKLEECLNLSRRLDEHLRQQTIQPAPAQIYGHLPPDRQPPAARARRLEPLPSSASNSIQHATHWTASEPPLLERLPATESPLRLPLHE